MSTTKHTPDTAETVEIRTKDHSYGIFCYNSRGDLFLSSDWGMYGFSWRSFGQDGFREFLKQINAEYVYGKFELNYRYLTSKPLPKHCREHVEALIKEFVKYLNQPVTI